MNRSLVGRPGFHISMFWACVLVSALFAAALDAKAQTYPSKPIRLVVPYAPSGVADIVGRLLAERLQQNLGQPVVVVNKEGAGTIIGTEYAARSTPDGHTLLLISTAIVMNTSLGRKLPYDLERDLAPLVIYYVQPNVLVVHPAVDAGSVKELVAYAKAHPGKLRYGSSGVGAVIHLYTELFARTAGVEFTHVPYKGVAPAAVDLLAGRIDLMFSGILTAAPHVKSGKLRPLGISTKERSPILPDVVPISEQGFPDFDVKTWYGLFVPARTPRQVIDRLHGEVVKIVATPDFRERLAAHGGEAVVVGPKEFKAQIARELRIWNQTIQSAKIRVE